MKKIFILLAAVIFVSVGAEAQDNKSKAKKANMKTIQLTKADFLQKVADIEADEWKYLGDKPAIVDFYADWCGPCKAIAPILEELAAEFAGQIYVYKVDTEKERELSAAFSIRSIPTLLFIPMEGEPQIARGALPKDTLKEIIREVLLDEKPE